MFCEAVRTMVISEQFISDFCDMLHLSVSEKLGIDLALVDSENFEIRTSGTLHVHSYLFVASHTFLWHPFSVPFCFNTF